MSAVTNILLVGVGGQGTILAAKLLSQGLLEAGYQVKMSEIHGMSQRGGSVSTQIRFGERVYSPIMGKGEADVIIAFEKMEALRWIEYLKPQGKIIVNDFEIPTVPIQQGLAIYPDNILAELSGKAEVLVIDAGRIAASLGNAKVMNLVLLGALAKVLDMEDIQWEELIRNNVKKGFEEINGKAFAQGFAL